MSVVCWAHSGYVSLSFDCSHCRCSLHAFSFTFPLLLSTLVPPSFRLPLVHEVGPIVGQVRAKTHDACWLDRHFSLHPHVWLQVGLSFSRCGFAVYMIHLLSCQFSPALVITSHTTRTLHIFALVFLLLSTFKAGHTSGLSDLVSSGVCSTATLVSPRRIFQRYNLSRCS
jgi:hypothetical protein